MPSTRSLAAPISALVASTVAQTSVTSLFLYGFEGQNIVASVISAAPQATEYFITCAPGTDGSDCGFGPGVTWTEGPSTVAYHLTESGAFTMDVDCAVESDTATCTETAAGPEANSPGTSTEVISGLSDSLTPVTITAGLGLLSGGSATATASSGTAASTAAATGAAATETAATKTSSGSASGTSAAGAASSSAAAGGTAQRAGLDLAVAGLAGLVGLAVAL
ncbi:unnamed protein product [Discula destructiva]